jgi:hypothetical protein
LHGTTALSLNCLEFEMKRVRIIAGLA